MKQVCIFITLNKLACFTFYGALFEEYAINYST
jgi:hypothetical protein